MDGRIEEINGFKEMLASTQSLQEKPAAERLVAILNEKLRCEPEKLQRFHGALNQVLLQICASVDGVVTVKQVTQVFLQRVEASLEDMDIRSNFVELHAICWILMRKSASRPRS